MGGWMNGLMDNICESFPVLKKLMVTDLVCREMFFISVFEHKAQKELKFIGVIENNGNADSCRIHIS
jgi:hypothetical protein